MRNSPVVFSETQSAGALDFMPSNSTTTSFWSSAAQARAATARAASDANRFIEESPVSALSRKRRLLFLFVLFFLRGGLRRQRRRRRDGIDGDPPHTPAAKLKLFQQLLLILPLRVGGWEQVRVGTQLLGVLLTRQV